MKKVYQKKDMFSNVSSLRIDVAGKSKTIAFENKRRNGILTFETSDEEVQKGIEASNQYADGKIVCVEGIVAPKAPVKTEEKYTGEGEKGHLQEYPEFTTFAQAKEVLRGDPYKVGATSNSLKTAEGVLAKAEELGISFPNLSE